MWQVKYHHSNTLPQYFWTFPSLYKLQNERNENLFQMTAQRMKVFCEFRNHIYIPSTSALRPLMEAGRKRIRNGERKTLRNIIHTMWGWEFQQKGWVVFFLIFLPPGTASNSVNSWGNLAKSGSCKKICSTRAWSKVIVLSFPRNRDNYK